MTVPYSEFSEKFVSGMRDRMEISFHKYGPIADAYPSKVNAIESCNKRVDKYFETGNTEWLIDAANFLMIEFMHPSHPSAHFKGTDSKDSPGRITQNGEVTDKENKDIEKFEFPQNAE